MKPGIIVAVLDSLSAARDAAVTRALSLARWYGSDLHVVYVRPSHRNGEGSVAALRAEVSARTERVAAASGAEGVTIVSAVLAGTPVRAIADYTERVSADLVVVGRRARRGIGYWSRGSFAVALGKAAKAPTIAVDLADRQITDSGSSLFRNVLVAIDFSATSRLALAQALALAQQNQGRLRLLHVLDGFPYETVYSGSRAFQLMQDFRVRVGKVNRRLHSLIPSDAFNWSDIDVSTVSGTGHEAILASASAGEADLIVLGLPRRSRLDEFLAGSTVHRVLRRAKVPVLLVPGPAAMRSVVDESAVPLVVGGAAGARAYAAAALSEGVAS